jgi:hypothetical protein
MGRVILLSTAAVATTFREDFGMGALFR